MLDYADIHLLIEQGLNTLGLFAEQANLHEQIDLALNHVIVREVNQIVNLDSDERNAIEVQLAKMLSSGAESDLEREGRFYTSVLTPSFLIGDKARVVLASLNCSETSTKRELGYYKAVTYVTYDGKGYDEDSIFKVTDFSKITYGEVEKVVIKEVNAIVVDPESFDYYTNSPLWGKGIPIATFDKTQTRVNYQRKDAIPIIIKYRALSLMSEEDKLDWCIEQTLNLPENLQHYFIDKVIAYLAIVEEKDQQNIVNLKTETSI